MEEIIVIRARDPDGSVFKAVMDSLKGKRAEVVDVAAPATSVLRIGELEIHHKHRRVLMAGRKWNSIMGSMPCSTAWPVHQGRCSPKRSSMRPPGARNIYTGQTPWRIPSGG